MQLSLPHCRLCWHREPSRTPSFVGDDGLFPDAAHRGRIIGPLPKHLPNGRGWRYSTQHSVQTIALMRSAVRSARHRRWFCRQRALRAVPCHLAAPAERFDEPISGRNGARRGATVAEILRDFPVTSVVLEAVTPLGEDGFEFPQPFRRLSILDRIFGAPIMTDRNHADLRQGIVDTCKEMN